VEEVIPPRTAVRHIGLALSLLTLLMTGCTWLVPPYRHDIEAARARIATGSQVADTACGPIEYATAGEGPPLLVVHGAAGGFDQGLMIGAPLIKAGYQVIAVSRFGYLRTPLPADASPEAQADAYACLLDALRIPRVALVGASAGSPSALQFALRHPERCRALVLLVPVVFAPPAKETTAAKHSGGAKVLLDSLWDSDFFVWLAPRLTPAIIDDTLLGTPADVVEQSSPEEQARVAKMTAEILPVEPRRAGMRNDMNVLGSLQRVDLERIAVPTLVISTADDRYGTYGAALYTSVHVAGAQFIGYTTGGHMLVGHQSDTAAAISAFLKHRSSSPPLRAAGSP